MVILKKLTKKDFKLAVKTPKFLGMEGLYNKTQEYFFNGMRRVEFSDEPFKGYEHFNAVIFSKGVSNDYAWDAKDNFYRLWVLRGD